MKQAPCSLFMRPSKKALARSDKSKKFTFAVPSFEIWLKPPARSADRAVRAGDRRVVSPIHVLGLALEASGVGAANRFLPLSDRKSKSMSKLMRPALKAIGLTRLMLSAAILCGVNVAFSQPPARAVNAQFAYIRPTYGLREQADRAARPSQKSPHAAVRKSGNISPLKRELPPAIAQPPKTRRRPILW